MSEPPSPPVDADAIYDDFMSRRHAGEAVDFEAICRAHADVASQLRKREAARALLDRLLPGTLASDGDKPANDGGSGSDPDASAEGAGSDANGGTIQELLARLHAVGPRGSRYRVVSEIARGGMGIVLRVVDTELRRKLAMKVARAPSVHGAQGTPAPETKALDRFLQEAQITSQLDHPGVVPVYEIGIGDDGRVFFTMRYVRGQTLKEVFELVRAADQGWTQLRAVHVLLRVCETMSYAHDRNTIHRDLKPANIMVGRFGEVYVMDWGLARVLGCPDAHAPGAGSPSGDDESRVETLREDERDVTPDSPRLTMEGEVLGTPAYMAPEQAGGEHEKVGQRSDVYAVGAMLYHLIAGEMPYVPAGERVSSHAVRLRVVAGPPRPLHELGRKSPPALVAVCQKAMARRVEDRYADMRALASDLRAYTEGRVVAAYETGSWAETKMWVRRNKALAGLLAGIVAALLSVAPAIVQSLGEGRRIEQVRAAVGKLRQFERDEGDPDLGRQLTASATTWWCDRVDALLASHGQLDVEVERQRRRVQLNEGLLLAALATYGRREELETKRGILRWRQRMLGDDRWPELGDVQREVNAMFERVEGADGLQVINRSVFRRVRPDEPRTLGEEVLAHALADRLMHWRDASLILPTYRDTYAFCLFRVGQWDRAVHEQEHAAAAQEERVRRTENDVTATEDTKKRERDVARALKGNLDLLTTFRDDWRNVQRQRHLTEDLAADVTTMEREIEDDAWSLAMGVEASWYRDVARALRRLDQLQRRRSSARRMTEDVASVQLWQRAIEGVANAPEYGGHVQLTPQIDLLPLEQDPESHLWEFVHLPSGVAPKRGPDGKYTVTPETGIVFVLLPGGSVPPQDGQPLLDMHKKKLDPFFLSKYELTRQQWARLGGEWNRQVMADAPEASRVLNAVSWSRATGVLASAGGWLCLPTSAQWEFGCRAGTTTRWWTGNQVDDLKGAAMLDEWSPHLNWRLDEGRANRFGLHNTLGNVAEWCSDGPKDDVVAEAGDGRRTSSSPRRWIRGGTSYTRFANVYTGFRPKTPGDEDLDQDGDNDLLDEAPVTDSPSYSGLRLARPLLR